MKFGEGGAPGALSVPTLGISVVNSQTHFVSYMSRMSSTMPFTFVYRTADIYMSALSTLRKRTVFSHTNINGIVGEV